MKESVKHQINYNELVISIKGLEKSFDELDVLRGVDFTLFRGENVAVLGKSGTGKSDVS